MTLEREKKTEQEKKQKKPKNLHTQQQTIYGKVADPCKM